MIGSSNAVASAATASTQTLDTPLNTGGTGGLLNGQRDRKEAETDPQYGEVMKNMQARYGAKAEKPHEIKKTLGKDDFLRIMITQMKQQDPSSPFKPEQMAAQMAQFASVEQLTNMNQALAKMTSQNSPVERMAMTNLIGKTVTVDRDRFPHKEGDTEPLSYQLPRDAMGVKVAVVSESGEIILEKDLGPQKTGEHSFTWDGLKSNTLPAKSGNFMLRVDAKDDRGVPVQTNPKRQAKVIGVSFEGNEAVFLVGDAQHQEKVTMKNIVRIESEASQSPGASARSVPGAASSTTSNLNPFQKAASTGNLNVGAQATPDVADALARYQANQPQPQVAQASSQGQSQQVKAEGFPNGLHDTDEPVNNAVNLMNPRGGEKAK